MECTQKLECTEDLYETYSQRLCPQEVGFLGICGEKYPIKKGPNKIGRDPKTCNIILNQKTISKQHAVINILSNSNFMLMDLDSANKTRLLDKILKPYLPHPLKNGDTIQFGDVFGVFQIHDDDEELPMTQAIDIPETPIHNQHISRIAKAPITMVPESPDVSDRDESFVTSPQKKEKGESSDFIKTSAIAKAMQHIGSNKIDNVYWNSSNKSNTLILTPSNSTCNPNISDKSLTNIVTNNVNIHEMDTQEVCPKETPDEDQIQQADTEIPEYLLDPSIDTATAKGQVRKVNTQHEMQINLYAINKELDENIYSAETQMYAIESPNVSGTQKKGGQRTLKSPKKSKDKINSSHEAVIPDEIDTQSFDGPLEPQNLIPEEIIAPNNKSTTVTGTSKNNIIGSSIGGQKLPDKRTKRAISDDSTDCEDMDITDCPHQRPQVVSGKPNTGNDDETDCEDFQISIASEIKDLEDLPTQVINFDPNDKEPTTRKITGENIEFEDMPTQVILEDMPTQVIKKDIPIREIDDDVLTQVIDEDVPTQIIAEDAPTQVIVREPKAEQYSQEMVGSFRIPSKVPLKSKRINAPATPNHVPKKDAITVDDDDDKYYQSTQDVFNDLCTQEQYSPELMPINNNSVRNKSGADDQKLYERDSTSISQNDDEVNQYVDNLSSQQIRDVIGTGSVKKLKRMPSDSSDLEPSPKVSLRFTDSDLPNSQEIKKYVKVNPKPIPCVISSDSETENDSEKLMPPVVYRRETKRKTDVKLDLNKMLKADALPSRIMTRVRKPSAKVQLSDEKQKKAAANMLKSKLFTEQEDNIDDEIITENLSRLKTKGKSKTEKDQTKESNIKSYFKVLDKSNVGIKRDFSKQEDRGEISKTSKSKTGETSKSEISLNNSSATSKNIDIKLEAKSSRSTRTRRNKTQDCKEIEKPSGTSSRQAEKQTKLSKTTDKLSSRLQEVDNSKESLDSTAGSNTSTRKTRRNAKVKVEKISTSPSFSENDTKPKRNGKREKKAPEKVAEKSDSINKETEIRRSKRQKPVKDTKENVTTEIKTKSVGRKRTHDKNIVCDSSLEQRVGSSKSVKRSAVGGSEGPSPKRTRSDFNASSCSIRPPKTQYVLYSCLFPTEIQTKLEKLGAATVQEVRECSVFMAARVRRSLKLLCAVGLGRPVVGAAWVQACMDTKTIVDPWLYILKDEQAEKRYNFDLERTLRGKRNYLKGYRVSSTPSVLPNAKEMKEIVECSGGLWGEGAGGGVQWVCVSLAADRPDWAQLRARGATLVSPEFILTGVLHQRADVRTYALQ